MPRETIATRDDFRVEVVWRRGVYSSIGVVKNKPSSLVIEDADGEQFDSLWGTLDPDDVDRLIKILRRVKRQLALEPSTKKDDAYKPLV